MGDEVPRKAPFPQEGAWPVPATARLDTPRSHKGTVCKAGVKSGRQVERDSRECSGPQAKGSRKPLAPGLGGERGRDSYQRLAGASVTQPLPPGPGGQERPDL